MVDRRGRLIRLLPDVSGGLGGGEVVGLGVVLDRLRLILALLGGPGRGPREFREVGSLCLRNFRGIDHVPVLADRCRGREPLGRRLGVHLGLAERGRAEETGPAAGYRRDENDLWKRIKSGLVLLTKLTISLNNILILLLTSTKLYRDIYQSIEFGVSLNR